MAEASEISFSYKEVAEALIRQYGLHEGLWCVSVKFGIQASNFGPTDNDLKPTALIPILEFGLHKQNKETNLTVDAAKVNPKPRQSTKRS
jgi:hypothetical protein